MTTTTERLREHEVALADALREPVSDVERALVEDALADVREAIASDAQIHSEDGRAVE